jgi:cytochrome P450
MNAQSTSHTATARGRNNVMIEDIPVVDFDHHSADFAENAGAKLKELRETCPVAWSENYGGFWVVTDYEGNHEVLKNPEIFTAERWPEDDGHGSILIPKSIRKTEPALPMELDPPGHTPIRQLLNPVMSPKASQALLPRIRHWTTHHIDAVIELGRCDLLYDVTGLVPAYVSLEWLGFPLEHAATAAEGYHNLMGYPPGSERYMHGAELTAQTNAVLWETIQARRAEPADDILSFLMTQDVDGRPVDDQTIMNLCASLISGGVDTTTSLTSSALVHLERDRDLRQRLIDEPELLDPVTEEFLRVYPPLTTIAKTARQDTKLRGCPIGTGDRLLISRHAANFDAAQFERPEEFIPDRFPNRHVSFGLGPHRCSGSHLARLQFQVMLTQILQRMPDYELDLDAIVPYPDRGLAFGWASLPATFTPGPRKGGAQ